MKTTKHRSCEEVEMPELYLDIVGGVLLGHLVAYVAYSAPAIIRALTR
jgi:hypothetical protein